MSRLDNPVFKIEWSQLDEEHLWQHYQECLEQHDWTYQYADDHRYWVNGQRENDYLTRLKKKLEQLDEKRANSMYFARSPFHEDDGTLKNI